MKNTKKTAKKVKPNMRIGVQLDQKSYKKLIALKRQTGLDTSKVLRQLINKSNPVSFKQTMPKPVDVKRENIILSERLTIIRLLKNLTNNVNQIAHKLNAYKDDVNSSYLLYQQEQLTKQTNGLRRWLEKKLDD